MARPMPNIYNPNFDEQRDTVDGFHASRARLGYQLGTERIGVSLWSVPAGQVAYPYHFHLAEEEVLVLLEGDLALRTPTGWERVRRGDDLASHEMEAARARIERQLTLDPHRRPRGARCPRHRAPRRRA